MKVGIMSMQRVKNYGSFLQAYALKKTIEAAGHAVEFVDFERNAPIVVRDVSVRHRFRYILSEVKWSSIRAVDRFFLSIKLKKHITKNRNRLEYERFMNEYDTAVLPLLGVNKEYNLHPYVDILVVGSDEVFNCLYSGAGHSYELYGDYPNAKKIISYAASFGFATYEQLERYGVLKPIKDALQNMSAISVRDENSLSIIKRMDFENIVRNVDPVLIYDFKNEIIEPKEKEPYMIIYAYKGAFKHNEKIQIINYARKNGYKIFCVGEYQDFCDEYITPMPFEVLGYFKNAKAVVTTTFHGTVFSIKYDIQFVSIIQDYNQQKIGSLLKTYGLENRQLKKGEQVCIKLEQKIDYITVNTRKMHEKKRANEYIVRNLFL